MQQRSIVQYFLKGFSLTNQSLDIFFISVLLFLPFLFSNFMPHTILGKILSALSIVLIFITLGFNLSLPVFLVQRQQKKALDYREIIKVVLKNTKRIILPSISLFILLTILLILSLILTAIFIHPSREEATSFFQNIGEGWQPIFLTIVLISFLEFTSFFFSLEHNGLLNSIKKSVLVAFNNLYYVSIVTLFSVISYFITGFIPIEPFWGQLARTLLGGYIGFALTASSLFYYQTVIKRSL